MGFKPFALQDKALGFEFFPNFYCAEGGVYNKIASQPLFPSVCFLLVSWHVGVAQLGFSFLFLFSEQSISSVGIDLVCLREKVTSESSYNHFECAEQNFCTWKAAET